MAKRYDNYAFLDSQNLNLGTRKDIKKNGKIIHKGWRLDYKKFRQHLKDKLHITKAYIFIGYVKENKELYEQLRATGYELIFKPTVKDPNGKVKGNEPVPF